MLILLLELLIIFNCLNNGHAPLCQNTCTQGQKNLNILINNINL